MLPRTNRILHVAGDSLFASCEIALDAKLEGRRNGAAAATASTHLIRDGSSLFDR